MTPAMAAGVTKRLWEIGDMVEVLEAWEAANAGGCQCLRSRNTNGMLKNADEWQRGPGT
jgi:hypothetical protein